VRSRQLSQLVLLGALAGLAGLADRGAGALAGEWFHHEKPTPPPGRPRCIPHTAGRAGYAFDLNGHAQPTYTPSYVGYYVGGGSVHGGCARRVEDGTWGRDYEGLCFRRHVWLNWSHGTRYQGGTGAYDPDGPHVPDVIGLTISKVHNH
jgi:hypothetical protein